MMFDFQNGVVCWRRNFVDFSSLFRYHLFRKQTNEPIDSAPSVASPAAVGRGRLLSMLHAGTGKSPTDPSTSSDEQRKSQTTGETKRPETGKIL